MLTRRFAIQPAKLALTVSLALLPSVSHAQWQLDGLAVSTYAGTLPTIASDGAGGAIVTWYDGRSDGDIYAQRINAFGVPQWTAGGVALCAATGNQWFPTIVSDGAGGAIVTWRDYRNGNDDIYVQRINASGAVQWTADGVALCTAAGDQQQPAIVPDGAGGAIVTWYDSRNGNDDIYAQRINASGAAQWTADGVALCAAAGDQQYPTIAPDGAGGAIVTWNDRRGPTDVYAQRINASGAVQWAPNGVALCTAAGTQEFPTIASDGAGGAIVTWYDHRAVYERIYAQRINASGAVQWTANGVGLCLYPGGGRVYPTIVADGAAGAIVTWYDSRNGYDIYAQRVNASGVAQWTANGVALCTAADNQFVPTIVSDGAGGAIVTWDDKRSGTNFDIYAQRISALGAVQWTADGVPLCTAQGDQIYHSIVEDGAGGAIVTWQDSRSGTNSIYAQQVGTDGGLGTTDVSPFSGTGGTPAITGLSVHQNYPNPFAGATEMQIGLPADSDLSIEIYDVAGRRVLARTLAQQKAGWLRVPFDGRDGAGRALSSGVYLFRITANGTTVTSKMVIAPHE